MSTRCSFELREARKLSATKNLQSLKYPQRESENSNIPSSFVSLKMIFLGVARAFPFPFDFFFSASNRPTALNVACSASFNSLSLMFSSSSESEPSPAAGLEEEEGVEEEVPGRRSVMVAS